MFTPVRKCFRVIDQWLFKWLLGRFTRGRNAAPSSDATDSAETILLFKPDGIGDFILWSEVFKEFAVRYNKARITMVCCAPVGELVRAMFPEWQTIELSKRPGSNLEFLCMSLREKSLRQAKEYDLLVDLRVHRGEWELLAIAMLKASCKIGFAPSNPARSTYDRRIFDTLLRLPERPSAIFSDPKCHELKIVDSFCSQFWSIDNCLPPPDLRSFFIPTNERQCGERIWIIAPFAGASIREYPLDKWAGAISIMCGLNQKPDCVFVCGSMSQRTQGEKLSTLLNLFVPTQNVCGEKSLTEIARSISKAALVLAVESGLSHLSVALRRPTVVILGGGHYGQFAPWGESVTPVKWVCRPMECFSCNWCCCYAKPLCITEIQSSDIVGAAENVLSCS